MYYMYILTVAPITRGVLKDTLSYFSKDPCPLGRVLFVPVQKREVPALVIGSQEVTGAKSAIKSSGYMLRKIAPQKGVRIWNESFVNAAEETARYSVGGLGETLLALTPQAILNAYIAGELPPLQSFSQEHVKIPLPSAIQSDTKTRTESYQRLIRESFVHNKSTFVCVPSPEAALRTARTLAHGIENYTYVFHSGMTKKRLLEQWEKALKEEHAILVIGTPQYLVLARHFATIIIEEEQYRGWKTLTRPLIDMRTFVEAYARNAKSTLIFGASLLRLETHKRIQEGTVGEYGRIAAHSPKELSTALIDPRIEEKEIRESTGRRTMQVLGKEVRALLREAIDKKEHVLLISARKGLSPITVCGDCGTTVRCPVCETPLTIHTRGTNTRIFSCHACGFTRVPEHGLDETCPSCKSWRLEALGIGTERIEKEMGEQFPDTHCFVFDGDRISTRAQAHKLIAQFEKTAGSVLIGTPMVAPYLTHVEHVVIVSLDSLFAIPDFQMNERIFSLILALREKTEKSLFIQTRADDTSLLAHALRGDLASFIEGELNLRKVFSYPPYYTIIKINLRGTQSEISTEIEKVKTFLESYNPIIPSTSFKESKNMFRRILLLKLPNGAWVDNDLLAKLRALPLSFTVEVNPDHLL